MTTTGPWVVGVVEARRSPGVPKAVRVAAPLADLGLSSAAVPADADVVADLHLEALTDGRLVATGTVSAPWAATCRRCLGPVGGEVTVAVQEVFEPRPDPDAETYALDGDHADLEPMVRDAVLLALPLAPLCRPDCEGPDPDHPIAVEGDATTAPAADPRWAALDDLRFE